MNACTWCTLCFCLKPSLVNNPNRHCCHCIQEEAKHSPGRDKHVSRASFQILDFLYRYRWPNPIHKVCHIRCRLVLQPKHEDDGIEFVLWSNKYKVSPPVVEIQLYNLKFWRAQVPSGLACHAFSSRLPVSNLAYCKSEPLPRREIWKRTPCLEAKCTHLITSPLIARLYQRG